MGRPIFTGEMCCRELVVVGLGITRYLDTYYYSITKPNFVYSLWSITDKIHHVEYHYALMIPLRPSESASVSYFDLILSPLSTPNLPLGSNS